MFKKFVSVMCISSVLLLAPTTCSFAAKSATAAKKTATAKTQTSSNNKSLAPRNNIFKVKSIDFNLKGLDGVKHNSKNIFSSNKLTLINFWGTLCDPCIKELPELQKLNDELSDKKFGVIGIVGDVTDDEGKEDAKSIILKKRVSFTNLIPDDKLQNTLLSKISGYPVSVFVDSSGNIVGDVITGAKEKKDYKEMAEKLLSQLK